MSKGHRIKALRESLGMSQVELAKKINVSKQTLYKYENGIITNIPSDKIEAIADATHSTPSYIMGWNEKVDSVERILTSDESLLIDNYKKLNQKGKDKAQDYISDLADQKKYTQDAPSSEERLA